MSRASMVLAAAIGADLIDPSLTTATPVGIAAASGWTTVSFSLASADLQGCRFAARPRLRLSAAQPCSSTLVSSP